MADLITVRVVTFLLAFGALRLLMAVVIERPSRGHGLGLMGLATLLSFLAAAVLLDDPIGRALFAWAVIFLVIAIVMFARWKVIDHESMWRKREAEAALDETLPERRERDEQ